MTPAVGKEERKEYLASSLFDYLFSAGTNDKICQLGKSYLSWMVTAVVSLLGDSKGSNFRNSLVSCLDFHDSALLSVSRMLTDAFRPLVVCVIACGCPENCFFLVAVSSVHICHCVFSARQTLLDSSLKSKKSCPHSCRNSSVLLKGIQFVV